MDVSIEAGGVVQGGSEMEIAQESEENKNNQSFKSSTPGTSSQANRRKRSPTGKEQRGKKLKEVGEYGDDNKARAFFRCDCMVCKTQITKGHLFEVKKKINMSLLNDTPIQFPQLIEWMFANSDKIKGAQILFPDTVFFEDGKPSFIAKVDKEGCMVKITQTSKLGLQDIRQKFSQLVRDRRKENGLLYFPQNPGAALLFKQNQTAQLNAGEEVEQLALMQNDKQADDKTDNKKDVVIIRYNPRMPQYNQQPVDYGENLGEDQRQIQSPDTASPGDAAAQPQPAVPITQETKNLDQGNDDGHNLEIVKIAKDIDFINMFKMRANDPEWNYVNCIQTCIKARTIGQPIYINFFAPINEKLPHKEIEYGVHARNLPDDYEMLKSGTPEDDETYAFKQCLKMAHYLQKVYQQEILQMKAEFLKDENGNIWFHYASNIQIRSRLSKNGPQVITIGLDPAKTKALEQEEKEQLMEEVTEYQKEAEGQQTGCVNRILGIMENYYSGIKNELGIAETQKMLVAEQDGQNDDVLKLDEVLKKLRPNCNAKNFKEFLQRQDNVNKNSKWKRISRKVHPNMTQVTNQENQSSREFSPSRKMINVTSEQLVQSMGISSQAPQQIDPREQRLKIQHLLNNLDLQNGKLVNQTKETIASIKESRQRLMSPQKQSPSPRLELKSMSSLKSGISMVSPIKNKTSRLGEMRNRTILKAELVKKQLLNRGDFMKLYQPPIPISSLPYNNPFYTKTIISQQKTEEYQQAFPSPMIQKISATPQYISENQRTIQSAGMPADQGFENSPYVHMNKRRSMQMTTRTNTQQNAHPQSQEGQRIASHSRFSVQINNQQQMNMTTQQQTQPYQMMDWSKFQGNKTLQKQISRRMEYLKMQDTFKPHQGIQDYMSSCATGQRLHMTPGQGSQVGVL